MKTTFHKVANTLFYKDLSIYCLKFNKYLTFSIFNNFYDNKSVY